MSNDHYEEASAPEPLDSSDPIFRAVKLPSGRRVQNRLVKVAMYEHLASFRGGLPNSFHTKLYLEWAKHGWGMIITGNVIIDNYHLTLGRDIVLPPTSELNSERVSASFKKLADSIHGVDSAANAIPNKTLAIMQLSHAGRQSANVLGGRFPFAAPMAPSAIRVAPGSSSLISRGLNWTMFQIPKEMSKRDINKVIDRFVEGAVLAYKSGFDGVQLHAAHGYLLAQFLSPKCNKREDIYSSQHGLDIVQTIAAYIREYTSSTFIISIKLNAAEYTTAVDTNNSLTDMERRAMDHIMAMATWGLLDFIEISGGDYEKPDFMISEDISRSRRQAFFANFSQKALSAVETLRGTVSSALPLILLTGGLTSLDLLETALRSNHAHLLGIGRASVICPNIPRIIDKISRNPENRVREPFGAQPRSKHNSNLPYYLIEKLIPHLSIIGAGIEMATYVVVMRQIATSSTSAIGNFSVGPGAVLRMWMWAPYEGRKLQFSGRTRLLLAAALPIIVYLILKYTL